MDATMRACVDGWHIYRISAGVRLLPTLSEAHIIVTLELIASFKRVEFRSSLILI